MNPQSLTDEQLAYLLQHRSLTEEMKVQLEAEANRRSLDQAGVPRYDDSGDIPASAKLLCLFLPFFALFWIALAARYIGYHERGKRRQFWKFLSLGFIGWTGVVFLLSYFILPV